MEIIKLAVLNFAAFFSKKIHLNKKEDKVASVTEKSPAIADLNRLTGVLTIRFFEDLSNVYVEIFNDGGRMIYNEPLEDVTAFSDFSIILTYEHVGDYHLNVICNDIPIYTDLFEVC